MPVFIDIYTNTEYDFYGILSFCWLIWKSDPNRSLNHISNEVWCKLLMHSQTSTAAPLKKLFLPTFFTWCNQRTLIWQSKLFMVTSSNGNNFRGTGHLCGEFTGHRLIKKKRPVTRSFDVFFTCVWINDWVNNREAGDVRRHRAHYEVSVIITGAQNWGSNEYISVGPFQ